MQNPFELIEERLSGIEQLLKEIKSTNVEPSKTPINKKPLDLKEAAAFLKLSTATIYSKVSKNQIPFMKKGNRLYFSEQELIAYLAEGRNTTYSEAEAVANSYISQPHSTKK